jgi:hypothetical protein
MLRGSGGASPPPAPTSQMLVLAPCAGLNGPWLPSECDCRAGGAISRPAPLPERVFRGGCPGDPSHLSPAEGSPWSHPGLICVVACSGPQDRTGGGRATAVDTRQTLLKVLLTERHLQRWETFRAEYERVASQLAPELRHTAPSRAQYFRWLNGQLKGGSPYPDACRVLEVMLPPWTADDLFGPPPVNGWQRRDEEAATAYGLLGSVPPSFPAEVLQGAWVTSYRFSEPPKRHVDVAHLTADGDRKLRATNYPPEPRTEGHPVPFRNVIEGQLVGRHLVGHWRNDSDARYFGAVHLAALPGENVLAGHYTGYGSDIEVSNGRWTWVRLDPASLAGIDLGQACLRNPLDLAELLDAHSQPYSPPLSLAAIVEEPET